MSIVIKAVIALIAGIGMTTLTAVFVTEPAKYAEGIVILAFINASAFFFAMEPHHD